MKSICVIGAGPAGLMAAIAAADSNNKITIFEKEGLIGKKLLLTGNGRCNLSNASLSSKNYHGENSKFVESVFARHNNFDTIEFFRSIGVETMTDERNRIYPSTERAIDVVNALSSQINKSNIELCVEHKIITIRKQNDLFEVTYLDNNGSNKTRNFEIVIISTGGRSYPSLGSDGSGYDLADKFGHNIIKPIPVSVPVVSSNIISRVLMGVTLKVNCSLYHDESKATSHIGDMILTHYGLSGPCILGISREISVLINRLQIDPTKIFLKLNFSTELNKTELFQKISQRLTSAPTKYISNQFQQIAPKSLVTFILRRLNIAEDKSSSTISKRSITQIVDLLSDYKLEIDGLLGWDQAQFTAGGVETKEIDSKTMRSKIVKDLYFAGEVVDIDGDTGGYNLQWAWSSGWLAGNSTKL